MEVTRDVIDDLLPAYLSGEASADTRRLVEEFLRGDPDFERLVREGLSTELLRQPVALPPDRGKQALDLTKRLIKRQTWFLAFALLFSAVPFSLRIEGGTVTFFMLQETPRLALGYWLLACLCWFGYFRTRRRLRVSGV